MADISQRLIAALDAVTEKGNKNEEATEERLKLAEALLAEVSDIEDDSRGEFSGADTIKQMRDERLAGGCRKGA